MKGIKSIFSLLLFFVTISPHMVMGQEHKHEPTSAAHHNEPWRQLLDKQAPEFELTEWLNSARLNLAELKGKVILIRWWLETCPYCQATAPSLNEFHREYADKGLVIIGMYHPKPLGRTVSAKSVKEFSVAKQFEFPIAIDQDWNVLNTYWPKEVDMSYTSVSFLIDREGIIRYIHPGGSYSVLSQPYNDPKWSKDYHEIKAKIEELIKQ